MSERIWRNKNILSRGWSEKVKEHESKMVRQSPVLFSSKTVGGRREATRGSANFFAEAEVVCRIVGMSSE